MLRWAAQGRGEHVVLGHARERGACCAGPRKEEGSVLHWAAQGRGEHVALGCTGRGEHVALGRTRRRECAGSHVTMTQTGVGHT